MAKKRSQATTIKASDLPGVESNCESESQTTTPVDESTTSSVMTVESRVLTCSVPFLRLAGYSRRRVDVTLTGSQAEKLKGIQAGLEARDEKLESGRFVTSPLHAIQWMIENAE